MTVIVTLNGPIYRAILGDIGVISSIVKSVMYLARPIQVVQGQLIFLLIFSVRVVYVSLRYCSKRPISDNIVNTPFNIVHPWWADLPYH